MIAVIKPNALTAAIRAALGRYTPALVRVPSARGYVWKLI